jgi:hypothetical protein
MWVRKLIADLLDLPDVPITPIMEDNTAASKWCYNPVNHVKQKHIDIAYHFVREQVTEFRTLIIKPVPTVDQLADLATKALPAPRFEYLVRKVLNIAPDRSLRSTTPLQIQKESVHSTAPTCPTKPDTIVVAKDTVKPSSFLSHAKASCPPRSFINLSDCRKTSSTSYEASPTA